MRTGLVRTAKLNICNAQNHIRLSAFSREGFSPPEDRLFLGQGCQLLYLPAGSIIKNLNLQGGASYQSPWAALRGGVLKCDKAGRDEPLIIEPVEPFTVPTGFVLMDRASYERTRDEKHGGRDYPHAVLTSLSPNEPLYFTHASYNHPDDLFLQAGRFSRARFADCGLRDDELQPEFDRNIGVLFLNASFMDNNWLTRKPLNLLEMDAFKSRLVGVEEIEEIIVNLREGGTLSLTDVVHELLKDWPQQP